MPDPQTVIDSVLGLGVTVGGWLVKGHRSDMRDQAIAIASHEQRLQAFQLEVAKEYVTHTDLAEIKDSLRRIEDKLYGKADK